MPRGVYERKGEPVAKTVDDTALAANEKVGEPAHRTTPVRVPSQEDLTVDTTYMALKPMKVGGVKVQPGDRVDEAKDWRNVHNYVSAGYLAIVSAPHGGARF